MRDMEAEWEAKHLANCPRWEYYIEIYSLPPISSQFDLDGKQGWELVSVAVTPSGYYCVFKRPLLASTAT